METIALEFVPPNIEDGPQRAVEEVHKVLEHARACGMQNRIRHLMIPGMIVEDDDRPLPMKPKMDPLDVWESVRSEAAGMRGLCTQVTAFTDEEGLRQRFHRLQNAGIEGIIFVGVPRTMADGEGHGVAPVDALERFQDSVPNRGAILIPTRQGEHGRFNFKCSRGANFGMTQLLYSDAIVGFLENFAKETRHRPPILLSFGYVAKVEQRIGLIKWLIQDPGNAAVAEEQAFVAKLAESSLKSRRQQLLDLYKRVIDGVGGLGFPIGIHLEAPYGFVKPAFESFAEMLEYWAPDK